MAQVKFHRITCQDNQEFFSDEPYLLYNGERLAGPFGDVDEGESRNINRVRDLSGEALVELFESDFPDDDDFLASIKIALRSLRARRAKDRKGATDVTVGNCS